MSKLVEVPLDSSAIDISEYQKVNAGNLKTLFKITKKIRGQTVIHINATATPGGGGVAELLRSQVKFEKDIGLDSHWLTIEAPCQFFVITKKIHNFLQGKSGILTESERETYLTVNRQLGASLVQFLKRYESAIIVVHDPQPLPLIHDIPPNFFPIFRLHIDLSTPNPTILDFLRPFISQYKFVILSSPVYCSSLPWLNSSKKKVVLPAIDPFSEKNRPMGPEVARHILEGFEIDWSEPIVTQVSRFDPWKDPLGVIRAYYLAKNKIPALQLVLAGFLLAKDDPEARLMFEKIKKHDRGDPDIHLFEDTRELRDISNDKFINALYTASTIIIQKSLREGFGLTMTEAMWKGKPVIAGMTQGALLQIKNGKDGILVSSPEETARAIIRLVKDEKLRNRLGKAARQSVKRRFLFPRFILDNVRIYLKCRGAGSSRLP
jgi:trehalose synthase